MESTVFKYILVPATGTGADSSVFATALAIARLASAHLAFLHVRIDVRETLLAMATNDMSGGAGYDQLLETLEQEVAARQTAVEQAFRDYCEAEKLPASSDPSTALPSVELRLETGDEPSWIAAHGRTADLLVVGRAREGEPVAMDVLEACLMETGRPVLIVPAKARASLSGTVAIAWKDRPEAAKAVAAALPLIALADRVIILSVQEGSGSDDPSCERLRHALSWHNANTSVRRLKPDARVPAETLLAAASAADADVLVMGGYGHSRTREVIFGGFTRRVLTGADMPVLMAH
jgi:nucleotide-binding universal stress UspA family protein